MTNSIIIHATSFAWYVILDNDDIVETIEASHALWVRISFCTITQSILDEVNKSWFCQLQDDRQPDLFNNL